MNVTNYHSFFTNINCFRAVRNLRGLQQLVKFFSYRKYTSNFLRHLHHQEKEKINFLFSYKKQKNNRENSLCQSVETCVFACELRVQSIARDRKSDKGDNNSLENLDGRRSRRLLYVLFVSQIQCVKRSNATFSVCR